MEEQSQTKRFDDMLSQIKAISEKQDSTSKNVYEILAILRGDDFAGGMISAVKDHEVRIKKLEETNKKVGWTFAGLAMAGGYGLWEILKKLLPMLFVLLLFTSCLTQRKREDVAHRYIREHPATLAELCATHYPAKPSPGRVETVRDTTILSDTVTVQCPDSTVVHVPTVRTRYVDRLRIDTVVDGALVEQLAAHARALDKELAISNALSDQWRERGAHRLWWAVGLGVALLASIVLRFVRVF